MSARTADDEPPLPTTGELTAEDVIALLGLSAHPEGGFYRETFRDPVKVADGSRSASTAIYFLLRAGEISRWHRVDAAEVWHWYAGAPMEVRVVHAAERSSHRLGSSLSQGERPQVVVAAGAWQQALSLGAWTLVGCTVAPAFQFEGFELAPDGFCP